MSLRRSVPMRDPAAPSIADELHSRPEVASAPVGASYVWLAYSIFFFIEPIIRRNVAYWAECLAIYAVFLIVYTLYVRACDRRRRRWMVAAMYGLGLATMPFNSGATCFFVYVAAMLPFSYPTFRVMGPVMAGEIVTMAGMWYVILRPHLPVDYLVGGFFVLVVGISNTFVAKGKQADLRLKLAQEENVKLAATAERERIARDLHDVLGHTLSVIVLKAELAGRLLERDPGRAAREIADVEHTARTALAEVREAITGYRSKGLVQEIDKARLTLDAAGVALESDRVPPMLDEAEETVLALAMREAVTNIVRHAQATLCTVRFREVDGRVCLTVEDNGQASRRGGSPLREGNGLRGMRERVEGLGGTLRVVWVDAPETGTRVCVEFSPRARAGELPADVPLQTSEVTA